MAKSIAYTRSPDNWKEVMEWIARIPGCSSRVLFVIFDENYCPNGAAGGQHEMRVISFVDSEGRHDYANWGDTIERSDSGLRLIRNSAFGVA